MYLGGYYLESVSSSRTNSLLTYGIRAAGHLLTCKLLILDKLDVGKNIGEPAPFVKVFFTVNIENRSIRHIFE